MRVTGIEEELEILEKFRASGICKRCSRCEYKHDVMDCPKFKQWRKKDE